MAQVVTPDNSLHVAARQVPKVPLQRHEILGLLEHSQRVWPEVAAHEEVANKVAHERRADRVGAVGQLPRALVHLAAVPGAEGPAAADG
eukprot:1732989-Pyramimonas_sp.AAC.2